MNLIDQILNDIRVDLSEEFDRNFERKAFFDRPWEQRKFTHGRGTLLAVSGAMRRSARCVRSGTSLTWSSSLPYFGIHNNGGKIPITPRMKRFFWAMYYQHGGGEKDRQSSAVALQWRNLALTKKEHFTMPKRQVIGDHPRVREICRDTAAGHIQRWADQNLKNIQKYLKTR